MEASIRETIMQCFGRGINDIAREMRNIGNNAEHVQRMSSLEDTMARVETSLQNLKDKLQVKRKSDSRQSFSDNQM